MILLRHTRTVSDSRRCHGSTDLPLADSFATEAAEVLAALPPVVRIVTSPLTRCARLAEYIGGARQLTVTTDARLKEMDFGRWEGLSWDDIPRAALDAWAEDFQHAKPHGGESVADLSARVHDALAGLDATTLVVTHNGVIRAALAAAGRPGAWEAQVPFGGWLEI